MSDDPSDDGPLASENGGGPLEIDVSRRAFLAQAGASLGMMYLGALTPELLSQAHAHAKAAAAAPGSGRLRFFTPEQAAAFDAFAAQIIPTDDTPGAREANVVHCVDYLLSVLDASQQDSFRKALQALDDTATKSVPGAKSFATLASPQQVELMKAMEKTPAFGMLRAYAIVAFFGDPELGGNKDEVGWKLIGFESTFLYRPPFGYYDAHPDEEKA